MTATENLIVLAVCVGMAYLVGKNMGQKAAAGKPCPGCSGGANDGVSAEPQDAMAWFATWSGMGR